MYLVYFVHESFVDVLVLKGVVLGVMVMVIDWFVTHNLQFQWKENSSRLNCVDQVKENSFQVIGIDWCWFVLYLICCVVIIIE